VVGLTRNALTSGGEAVAFVTVRDSQLIAGELPDEAVQTERQRIVGRLQSTDLGRSQPALEELALDARWRPPALPAPVINVVLVNVRAPHQLAEVRRDRRVGRRQRATDEQRDLLLRAWCKGQAADRPVHRDLTLTAAVVVMMVVYSMMLEKTHDIAVLS
jgi:putative ABC transport system permease protein